MSHQNSFIDATSKLCFCQKIEFRILMVKINLILMSESDTNFSVEESEISDHQKEFKSPKINRAKLTDRDQKIVIQWCKKFNLIKNHINSIYQINFNL